MNRLAPIIFGNSLSLPLTKKISTIRGDFEVVGNRYEDSFCLNNAAVMYTDEFLSQISASIFVNRRDVEINCGQLGFNSEFIFSELTSREMLERIQKFDREPLDEKNQELKIEVERRNVVEKGALFGFFSKKYLYLLLSEKIEKEENNNHTSYSEIDFEPAPPFDSYQEVVEKLSSHSKYFNAPVFEAGTRLNIFEVNEALNKYGVVQIVINDRLHFGLFIENRENPNEVIFNLNGQKENSFEDVFEPLVLYYLDSGKKIYVDYDLNNYEEINKRVFNSEIYRSIIDNSKSAITVKLESINKRESPHTCAVLEPIKT